ncbi:hypothetical protein AURDEDRAFT_115271 [Auricularia subglabra TFB-10046 SS5]|nr:hypothetical protein AURDEDRAFT_115271 [Auricularia subglabra TFB-10046 SS5]
MASEPTIRIPTPVGGTPIHIDAVPSIIFAVAFGALFPFIASRCFRRGAQSFLQIESTIFAIERIVVYALRATQALNPAKRASGGLLIYLQLSFAQGYISMAHDAVPLLRVLLVESTSPPDRIEPNNSIERDPKDDQPRTRFWVRRATDLLNWTFLAATIPNAVQGAKYKDALKNQDAGDKLMRFRYASTAVALVLIVVLGVWTTYAYFRVRNIRRGPCLRLLTLLGLMVPVSIYRLVVMKDTIPDLLYTGPGSQESGKDKALFYVFHCLPELFAAALLVVPNTRQYFGTGMWGDWRSADGQKGCTEARKEAKEKRAREAEAAAAQRV